MKNELRLQGVVKDIEFNDKFTRLNIECGNCTDEYCDTTDVCVYSEGDLTSVPEENKIKIGDTVEIYGHVVNDKDNVLVWLIADDIKKVEAAKIPEELALQIRSLYEGSIEDYEYVSEWIANTGESAEGVKNPDATYEAGYMNAIQRIIELLGIEVSE